MCPRVVYTLGHYLSGKNMPKSTKLDVLIVYNGKICRSAKNPAVTDYHPPTTPFRKGSRHDSCNIAYSYFLEICTRLHLKAGLSTSTDIIGPGTCSNYWTYSHKKWHQVNSKCTSNLIFDKYSPTSDIGKKKREILFSSDKILPYNSPNLVSLFFDKQKTYDALSVHSIPTITLKKNTPKSIKKACSDLAKILLDHPDSNDFTADIIMKDRYGAGGNQIYKFKSNESDSMSTTMLDNSLISFIIQPFTKFDQGFILNNLPTSTDIRLIYLGNKIIDSYIRTARPDDFRCNQHQGGTLTYLTQKEIPKKVLTKSNLIAKTIDMKNSLYSLDFIVSNSGNPYLLEGNSAPGLDWNTNIKRENINAKKFIRTIIKDLASRNL